MSVRRLGAVLRLSSSVLIVVLLAWVATFALATGSGGMRLLVARADHTATVQLDGSLVIAGGSGSHGVVKSLELFDPVSGKSTPGPRLLEARSGHAAIALPDGRVLLTGGRDGDGALLASSEIYDAASGALSAGAAMGHARANHTSTLLADGRVLIAGGDTDGMAEIYDPRADRFTSAGKLAVLRSGHAAVRLGDGRVLLVGGYGAAGATAEIFDPRTNTFSAVGGGLKTARVQPALKLISDGKVQVYGGDAEITMEVYNPAGYFSSRGHLLRDSSAFRSIMYSPGQAALVAIPPAHGKRYAEDALGPAASAFERSGHTATEVAARSMMVVVGGFGTAGTALDTISEVGSCSGTVTTDLTDYYPGQTVIMSGSGWNPGEQITLDLHRDTNDPPDTILYATADENGDWINAEYVVQEYDANVTFVLTATGDSGCAAQTTFTDSVTSVTITAPAAAVTITSLPTIVSVSFNYSTSATGTTTAQVDVLGTTNTATATIPASASGSATVPVTIAAGTANGSYNLKVTVTNSTGTGANQKNDQKNSWIVVNVPSIASTATTLASSLNPSTYGDNVTFTATVTAGVNPVTAGSVTFIEGGTCAAPTTTLAGPTALNGSGQAAFSTASLNAGSHTLTACYGGTASFAASSGNLTQVVNQATPTVTATGGTFDYNALPHPGSCTVTGVNNANLGPLAPTYTPDPSPDPSPVNAGSYTVHCDYAGSQNYNAKSNTVALTINAIDPTVTATGGTFDYNTLPHPGSCTVTGLNSVDLGPLAPTYTPDPSPDTAPVNAGSYTVHCDYAGSQNYNPKSDTAALTINRIDPTVTATGGTFDYNALPHPGSCSVTGVNSVDLGPLAPTYTPDPSPDTAPVNAGTYTVHCDYAGSQNYNPKSDTTTLTINRIAPTVTATGGTFTYDATAHPGSCTVTGVNSVDLGPLAPTYTPSPAPATAPTNAGTYTVHCDYPGSTNYLPGSATATLTIQPRDALVRYIGQLLFVTSGTSSTTAQVHLTASVQDPTGLALSGAKVDFIDTGTNKVMAGGVPVSVVANSPANTGTADAIVTLSTGQFGSQSYLILVKMSGNYDNTDQDADDKTANVVVAKPAATNETTGGGKISWLTTSAGTYAGNGGKTTFSVGMSYNKSMTNLKGQITLSVPQDGGVLYVKSNSITSMAVSGKASVIYTKASMYEVLDDGSIVTLDGNVTLRMDAQDASTDMVGFTVLSSKDSTLYYSNNWVISGNAWRTAVEMVDPGSFVTIN